MTYTKAISALPILIILLSFHAQPHAQKQQHQEPFEIAITIDDLPWANSLKPGDTYERATKRILSHLKAFHVVATGFVICKNIKDKHTIIKLWENANMEIGNHSYSHAHFDTLSLSDWKNDLLLCKKQLQAILKRNIDYFRYPYLQRGNSIEHREQGKEIVKQLGYQIAPVSVDTSDWILVEPYLKALQSGKIKQAHDIAIAYVDHVLSALQHYQHYSQKVYNRNVRHILLLHANALAADHLDKILAAISAKGYRFISLEKALQDEVYQRPDHYIGNIGLSYLYRISAEYKAHELWAWDHEQMGALSRRFIKKEY